MTRSRRARSSLSGQKRRLQQFAVGAMSLAATVACAASAEASGAVDALAQGVKTALGVVSEGAVVVTAPLVSDQPAPKGDDLALRVASLLAGRIGGTASPQTAPLGTARAIAGKAGALVYLHVEIARGELRATADVYPVLRNAWDRVRDPLPAPSGHAFAATKIDAEVRTFLRPLLLEQASVHKAKHDEGGVIAAACGDLDHDGGVELALVSRSRVVVGRIHQGAFVVEKSATWDALLPRAPAPLRDVLGSAVFGERELFVGNTDRGGVSIAADFAHHEKLRAIPIAFPLAPWRNLSCVDADPSASTFTTPAFECSLAAPPLPARGRARAIGAAAPPSIATPVAHFDAFDAARIVAPNATNIDSIVTAAREPSGKLLVTVGDHAARAIDGVGAQIAVADLDQDGVAETITTENTGEDAITITSWDGAEPKIRRRLPAPDGVRALAVCPPEERGAPALVAVVGGEIWVVRE